MRKYLIALLVGVAFLLCCTIPFFMQAEKFNFLLVDDAFYYLTMVKVGNLTQPTADGFNTASGYHPLWYWSLELVSFVSGINGEALAILTSLLVMLLSFVIWSLVFSQLVSYSSYAKCEYKISGIVLSFLMHTFPTFFLLQLSGMEFPIVVACIGLVYLAYTKLLANFDTPLSLPLWAACGLLFLARTDMVIPIIFILYLTYRIGRFKYKKEYLMLGGVLLCYFAYNLLVTNHLFQSSSGVYPFRRWNAVLIDDNPIKRYVGYVGRYFTDFNMWLDQAVSYLPIVFALPIFLWKSIRTVDKYFIAGVSAMTLLHLFGRMMYQTWYLAPILCVLFISFAFLYAKRKKLAIALYLIVISLQISQLYYYEAKSFYEPNKVKSKLFEHWTNNDRFLDQESVNALLSISGYDGKVGVFNSGEAGYFFDNVVNLDGLVNDNIQTAIKNGSVMKYLRDNNIYLIADVYQYMLIFKKEIPTDSFAYICTIRDHPGGKGFDHILAGIKTDNPWNKKIQDIVIQHEMEINEQKNMDQEQANGVNP